MFLLHRNRMPCCLALVCGWVTKAGELSVEEEALGSLVHEDKSHNHFSKLRFRGHGFMKNAGAGWPEASSTRYHIYLIMESHPLKDVFAFEYG